MRRIILSDQVDVAQFGGSPEQRERLARLRARAHALQASLVTVKAAYEAGEISLDEEIARFRGIERAMRVVAAEIHDAYATPEDISSHDECRMHEATS